MSTKIISVLLILTFVFGLAIGKGTSVPSHSSATRPATKEKQPRRFILNAAFSSLPIWSEPKKTWQNIAAKNDALEMIFEGPGNGDPSKQSDELESALIRKIDGVVVFPSDQESLTPAINKLTQSGIPVITIFADVPSSTRLTYVAGSEKEAARAVAEKVLNDFPQLSAEESQAFVVYAKPGISSQETRRAGIEEVFRERGGKTKIVELLRDEIDEVKGAEAVRSALTRHPEVKLIIGLDSRSAIGAISALKEAGKKPGDIIVTGWDGDHDVLTAIRERWVHLSPTLHLSMMLEIAYSILEAHKKGYLYPGTASPEVEHRTIVPSKIEVPLTLITAQNIDHYLN